MKLKQLLSGVLMAGLLFSCNEQEEPSLARSASEQVKPSLNLNLVAEVPADGMRLLEFDITERGPKIKRQASSFDTHAYFRKKSNPELLGYAKLTWDIVEDEGAVVKLRLNNGENLQVYAVEGMEHIEHGVTLLNPQPELGSDWYISGLASAEPEGAQKKGHNNRAHIAFGWTLLKDSPMIVKFLPQGVLLRVEVKNSSSKRIENALLEVESNAIATGSVTFVQRHFTEDQLTSGKVGFFRAYPDIKNVEIYRAQEALTLDAGQTTSLLLWGMGTGVAEPKTRVLIDNLQAKRLGSATPFESTVALANGQTKLLRVEFGEEQFQQNTFGTGRSPFARLTRAAVNQAGDGFALSAIKEHVSVGYFTWQEAMARFKTPVDIQGKKYYLPRRAEMSVFLPDMSRASGKTLSFAQKTTSDVTLNESVAFSSQDEPKTVSSQYRSEGNGIIYAIRFEDATNKHRAAYRYTRTRGGMLYVDAVTIGNDTSVTLDQISSSAWWSGKTYESVSMKTTGWKKGDVFEYVIDYGGYWTSNAATATASFVAYFWGGTFGVNTANTTPTAALRPVLLMLDDRTMPSGVSSEASDWADGGEG